MKSITVSIFFPAYNEEANIHDTVERTVQVIEDSPYIREGEIIIVNDGSTDGTEHTARALAAKYPMVRLISHPTNQGYGASLRTGIEAARMDYVFFTDADLQFDIVELQNLLVHLPSYDAVIGYRAPRRDPFMRLLNARVWNFLNRIFFGLRVRDIDCAFKIFRRELVQELALESRGAMLSAELLIRLSRNAVPIKEIPVTHLPRTRGAATGAKPAVILRALAEMLRLYRSDLGLSTQKQLLRFGMVGVVNTLLDVAVYVLLTRATLYFGAHLNEAKFLSFMLGTVSSLLLNRSWTFNMKSRPTFIEVARFYATASLSVLINVGLMNLLLRAGFYDLVALPLVTVATFAANFTLSKFWVFRSRAASGAGALAYR
jgi:glycosyltransferase involved in cell wall biosynthesis